MLRIVYTVARGQCIHCVTSVYRTRRTTIIESWLSPMPVYRMMSLSYHHHGRRLHVHSTMGSLFHSYQRHLRHECTHTDTLNIYTSIPILILIPIPMLIHMHTHVHTRIDTPTPTHPHPTHVHIRTQVAALLSLTIWTTATALVTSVTGSTPSHSHTAESRDNIPQRERDGRKRKKLHKSTSLYT